MNRTQKSESVESLREALEGINAVVLVSSEEVGVNRLNALRAELTKAGAYYRVVKNTLAKRAIKDTPMENLSDSFAGPTAIAWHPEDVSAPAKVILGFIKKADKKQEKMEVRAGWLNGTILDPDGVEALSKMPGKDELRAKLLSVFNGVPTKFVRVLNAAPQSFLNVLSARKDSL